MSNAIFNSISFRPNQSGSSNSPGVNFNPTVDGPANPNLNFFGVSDYYNNLRTDWTKIEAKSSENALKGASPSNVQSTAGSQLASAGVSSGLSTISGPVGLAAYISQQVGQGINSIQSAETGKQIQQDYAKNIQAHGVNVQQGADLVRGQQEAIREKAFQGGSIGSLFGPIGALIGHAIGGLHESNPDLLKTAVSSSGQINPYDTRISASASTAAPSGISTLIDNVTGN